jgi:glycosyltransferase involved in cell wall biosynthesis
VRICFFGTYDPDYSRTRVLLSGLRQNGVDVVECRIGRRGTSRLGAYRELMRRFRAIPDRRFDLLCVAFPGHTAVWLARTLAWRTPLAFDALLSLYDSNVGDRKLYSRVSLRALRDWLLDFANVHLADLVCVDTRLHAAYFTRCFLARERSILVVPVGADDALFHPGTSVRPARDRGIVHFHGTYIPLHGIPHILEAARLLRHEPLTFRLLGDGQEYARVRATAREHALSNVEFVGRVPPSELPRFIDDSDICLGIFGDSAKARRVIPNKVYECLAMGKPVVTARTPAVLERFSEESLELCEPANGRSLAAHVKALWGNRPRREALGAAGLRVFRERLTPARIAADFLASVRCHAHHPCTTISADGAS